MSKTNCVKCGTEFIYKKVPMGEYAVKLMMCDNPDCQMYHMIRMV